MRRLNIQIQFDRLTVERVEVTLAQLRRFAPSVTMCEGHDNGRYVNVTYEVDDVAQLWKLVSDELQTNAALAHASIVVCEGIDGWDDYLLLHHYDSTEPLDDLAQQ